MVYEEAPFESSAIMWICCWLCEKQRATGKRPVQDDPYLVRNLPNYDDAAVESILAKKLDPQGTEVLYLTKWKHYPPSFNAWNTAKELTQGTPTARAKLLHFNKEYDQQVIQAEQVVQKFLQGTLTPADSGPPPLATPKAESSRVVSAPSRAVTTATSQPPPAVANPGPPPVVPCVTAGPPPVVPSVTAGPPPVVPSVTAGPPPVVPSVTAGPPPVMPTPTSEPSPVPPFPL
jgi:hypothetical protein